MKTKSFIYFISLALFICSNLFAQYAQQHIVNVEDILKLNAKGELACQSASQKNNPELFKTVSKNQNYTLVRSTNEDALVRNGFKIILRATDQLMDNPEALLAFRRAAAVWERYIDVDMTTIIDVDFGVLRFGIPWDPNVLGSTNGARDFAQVDGVAVSVSDILDRIKAVQSDNAQLQELYNAIPIPTPSSYGTPLEILFAPLMYRQAMGFQPAHLNPDDYSFASGQVSVIGFNGNFNWDLDPNDGIDSDKYDFDGTVVHEIGHAIGFSAGAFFGSSGPPNNFFLPWDLFRVRPDAVEVGSLVGFSTTDRVTSEGPASTEPWPGESSYFLGTQAYFDGENEWECATSLGDGSGGDGSQASHWRDDNLRPPSLGLDRYIGIMDPNSGRGDRDVVHYADLRMLEVIGYNINYTPTFAAIAVNVDGVPFEISFLNDTLKIGNIDLNVLGEKTISIINNSTENSLRYDVELVRNLSMPDDLVVEVSTDKPGGEIAPSASENLILRVGNVTTPGIYFGTLRLHTNSFYNGKNLLVVEIPFEVNLGGAIAPTISLSTLDLGELKIDSKDDEPLLSSSFIVKNNGNLPLEYGFVTSISAPSVKPAGLFKSTVKRQNVLSNFYSEEVLRKAQIIYESNFESDFGGFVPTGDLNGDWNRIITGYADLDGHSGPTAVYYGNLDSMRYQHQANAALVGPELDLSSIAPMDMVVFAFNYYLNAEIGFDFAFVDVSLDGGENYQQLATSNGGILQEQTSEWQSIVIEIPELSGNPQPVVFRFRFESDPLENGEGFYIDDVSVTTIEGVNSIYTSPRSGVLANLNDTQEAKLFINSDNFLSGYYTGNLVITTNDVKRGEINLPFLFSKLDINTVTYNKFYATTGRSAPHRGFLVEIDPISGVGTPIGETGLNPVSSITVNTTSQELYALSLISADTTTTFLRIDATSGGGIYKYETTEKINCIAFSHKDNKLYGVGKNNMLYTIDTETGELTEIGDVGLMISAITFNPFSNKLFAAVAESSEKDRIYQIDITSGDTTLVGKSGLNVKIEGLSFGADRNLYGVQGSERQISKLIKIDVNTGLAEEIGSIGVKGIFGLAFAFDPATSFKNEDANGVIPSVFSLAQNYPNPFNPSTTISFALPQHANVKLVVYNSLGEEVAELVNREMNAGFQSVNFDASNLSSGLYFYRISAGNFVDVKKMILIK